MRVQFVSRENGPERLVSEAEILFDEPGLQGLKLVGFSVWRGADGDLFVTFPSRAFGTSPDRRYFDYLRSVEGIAEPVKNLKGYILAAHREQHQERPAARVS